MFDYSQSTVRLWPWPLPAPFGTDYTELERVLWTPDGCELTVLHRAKADVDGGRWRFRAVEPIDVIIQYEEGHVCSLWAKRDHDCPGAGGFLEVDNSPIINSILATDPVGEAWARRVRHYVLGTSQGVAHVLCDEPITCEKVAA